MDPMTLFDEDQGCSPTFPDPGQDDPGHAVGMTEAWSLRPPVKDGELLAQGEILQGQSGRVLEAGAEEQEDDSEDGRRCLPSGERADRSG